MISNIFNSKGIHVGTVTGAAILTRYLVRMGSKGWKGLDGLGQTSPSTRKIGERWPSGYWADRRTSTRNQRRIDQNHIADGEFGLKAKGK